MYLETIYLLSRQDGMAHGVDIARELGVSKASVTKAMKKLQAQGLVDRESYGAIALTDPGLETSAAIYRKHRAISAFLKHALSLSEREADDNACRMEHTVSDKLLYCIDRYLEKNGIEIQ